MKKLVNRVMATVLASSCMFSSVAMNGNAFIAEKVESEDVLLENGYTKFDDCQLLHRGGNFQQGLAVVGTYTDGESYYILNRQASHIFITLPMEADVHAITDLLYEKYYKIEDCYLDCPVATNNNKEWHYRVTDIFNELNLRENVKSIMNDIMEMTEIYNFYYSDSIEWVEEVDSLCDDITDYLYITEDDVEKLQKFVEENNLDFTVEVSDIEKYKRCHLIPNEGMTIDEQFSVASKIKSQLKLDARDVMVFGGRTFIGADEVIEIDVLNALESDANEDGNVNIADATAIVQAIGNPDKYKLTAQGEFNADADGNGLSGADAIAIQMKLVEAGMPK